MPERAVVEAPRPRPPNHSRTVLTTIGIWLALQVGLALVFGLYAYIPCRYYPTPPYSTQCGMGLGLTFLFVSLAQVAYGAVASFVAARLRRPAVAQGILIGLGIVLVSFTVVCFGATLSL